MKEKHKKIKRRGERQNGSSKDDNHAKDDGGNRYDEMNNDPAKQDVRVSQGLSNPVYESTSTTAQVHIKL